MRLVEGWHWAGGGTMVQAGREHKHEKGHGNTNNGWTANRDRSSSAGESMHVPGAVARLLARAVVGTFPGSLHCVG